MDSSRYPGKVLAGLAGHPILEHVVTRCQASGLPVVVATTDRDVDDPIVGWAVLAGVKVFRWDGKVGDVVGRFRACAEYHEADAIVRITADSPLIPPDGIAAVVDQLRDGAELAAVTAGFGQVPDGWEVEGCITDYLRNLDADANLSRYDREHIFPAIYSRAIAQGAAIPKMPACKWSESWFLRQRFSVDRPADLNWLRKLADLIDFTPPSPNPQDIYLLLRDNPALRNGQEET
jgi:spore coat polysaccharide biosynthesis protein SpsF